MKKNKLIALFAGLSLAFVGSAALAAPSPDTLLVAGYDGDQMAVLYGVSEIDPEGAETATLDCTVEEGEYVYVLNDGEDLEENATEAPVTDLKTKAATDGDPDGDVEFFDENVEELDRTAGEGTLYGEEGSEECALTAVIIEPNGNGEINHGMVVSTFAKLLQGGNGCLIRHFAQSDFGKGDYDEVDAESFEVTLKSIETACNKKVKSDSVDDDDDSESRGKANAPGQQDKDKPAKGKENAPGQQNKAAKGDDSSSD
jgi:hypothetical protein